MSHVVFDEGLHLLMVTVIEVADFTQLRVSHIQFVTQFLPLTLHLPHHFHEILSGEGGVS